MTSMICGHDINDLDSGPTPAKGEGVQCRKCRELRGELEAAKADALRWADLARLECEARASREQQLEVAQRERDAAKKRSQDVVREAEAEVKAERTRREEAETERDRHLHDFTVLGVEYDKQKKAREEAERRLSDALAVLDKLLWFAQWTDNPGDELTAVMTAARAVLAEGTAAEEKK